MNKHDELIISEVRKFSRFYTNIIGLLDQSILNSAYSLTEARILFEIGNSDKCTAKDLANSLDVDRGYMSRILSSFEADGLIAKQTSTKDGRVSYLGLTPKGKAEFIMLGDRSNEQIEKLIEGLSHNEKEKLVESFRYIEKKLSGFDEITIRDYEQKDIDFIINRHEVLYQSEFGFTAEFTDYVRIYVNKFIEHHDKERENIWIAEQDGKQVGVIAVVKEDDATAQLRWFLIETDMRGMGLGKKMVDLALDFCKEKDYKHVFLLTLSILKTARHIYSRSGFKLTETTDVDGWADYTVVQERWDLDL